MKPQRGSPPAMNHAVTPEAVVRVRAPELHAFTRVGQFVRVAAEHGFTDAPAFERFVSALREVTGIDDEGLRQVAAARRAAHRRLLAAAARGPQLTLWSAATMATFTVRQADGRLIWHDRFPPTLRIDTRAAAAAASARQAIWLAGHARAHRGAEAATLHLVLARSSGVDLTRLERSASAVSLVLDIITDPAHNPATEHSTHTEIVNWSDIDPRALLHPQGRPA